MTLQQRMETGYRVTMGCYVLFLLLMAVGTLWVVPSDRTPSVAVWALATLPLLAFLPGLLRRNFRSFIWLCFVLLLYFLKLVLNLFHPLVSWVDWALVLTLVALYTSSMFFARWQKQWQAAVAQDSTGPA